MGKQGKWDCDAYVRGVRSGDRSALGRAITLIESRNPHDHTLAQQLLQALLPFTGTAQRIGISGVPGVGKSTLIDVLGTHLTAQGHRVAVLAVDPSSTITGGSILGDKTRMAALTQDPHAFIRPSPSRGTLGGVADKTREAMLVCEAAGYDIVLVETVGVGQSEMVVADMVDVLLVLMLPGAGDGLQGIKRGILEVADLVCINKADGDNHGRARLARGELQSALKLLRSTDAPPVLQCSALHNDGIGDLWSGVHQIWQQRRTSGVLTQRRAQQQVAWMWSLIQSRLLSTFRSHARVQALLPVLEPQVGQTQTDVGAAADQLVAAFLNDGTPESSTPRA